ncbi:ureidoglycolate hydrolase [Cupriavidus sp. USMAHM13]|uniref:ureidoglycolate lyase n=1 Tax=Cupriavidus sp. USMAHM13 TaxID=1389192 RepID=UPI0008A6E4CB|nr:ureidoglycolate lyase [Cupriavidus sp. USMAHM13]AOZ02007.1 ureidoglycolate hydrolase [Cupriavidus sp. USMAHM13]
MSAFRPAAAPDPSTLLRAEPLTRAAFAPFGDVIEPRAPGDAGAFDINGGMVRRHHGLARVEVGQGHALINLFEARPYAYPLAIRMLERHPLGSQAFLPLDGRPFLVVVAPRGDTVRPEAVRAFFSDGVQGVNYHAGVWHHMLLAVGAPSRFAVVDRGGEGANCDEITLARPLWLALPAALASA